MKKNPKAIVLELSCPCGHTWTAAWPQGKIKSTCKCRACGNFIKTDGSSKRAHPPTECAGCKRPLLNKHHCTYCGRPVKESEAKRMITKEPPIMFCTDDNIPNGFKK